MNRPILTANLLLTEAPPTSAETTPTPAVVQEPVSPSHARSKSRANTKRFHCMVSIPGLTPFYPYSRKGQEVDSRVSNSSREDPPQQVQTNQSDCTEGGGGRGLLPADRGLQTHISHTLTNITSLPTLPEQALALARSVKEREREFDHYFHISSYTMYMQLCV